MGNCWWQWWQYITTVLQCDCIVCHCPHGGGCVWLCRCVLVWQSILWIIVEPHTCEPFTCGENLFVMQTRVFVSHKHTFHNCIRSEQILVRTSSARSLHVDTLSLLFRICCCCSLSDSDVTLSDKLLPPDLRRFARLWLCARFVNWMIL
jgi:hypothetical protein